MALGDIRKGDFIVDILLFAKAIAPWADISDELYSEYFDNGYNGGGADPIVDLDITSIDIPAATVTTMITLLENFNKFKNGVASVAASDYTISVNKVRYAVAAAELPTPKERYVSTLCQMIEGLLQWIDIGEHVYKCYWDNAYNIGIVQADLDKHSVALADFNNGITMLENFNNLFAGNAVAVVDFTVTINTLRRAII